MTRSGHRMAWLVGAVIALVIISLWQSHTGRQHNNNTLLDLTPQKINRIAITRAGHPPEDFAKHDGHWFRVNGASSTRVADAPLDALAQLAATPVLQWRRGAALDLGKIGLAPPAVTLQLNGHELAYGSLAAFGPQRFVRVGQRVAVIPATMSPRLPAAASAESPAPPPPIDNPPH